MSIEWACNPKFRYDGVYSPDDFKFRCKVLMGSENDPQVTYLLGV